MTLTLILTRHAKSSWATKDMDDFDRPLNDRGTRSAPLIGRWLADRDLVPDTAIVSGAKRTVETWAGMSPKMEGTPGMTTERALYLADAEKILSVIRAAEGRRLLILGHNPGIADCALRLAAAPPDHDRFASYPTGATTVMDFDADDWAGIGWGDGRVTGFTVPKDL